MHFAFQSFKTYFAGHHYCDHLGMPAQVVQENLASRWNCILVRLNMAAFTKLLLVGTEKDVNVHCTKKIITL